MEVYARELVSAMLELPDAPRLTAFVNREAAALELALQHAPRRDLHRSFARFAFDVTEHECRFR